MTARPPPGPVGGAEPAGRTPWLGAALLILAVLAAYANSLHGPFVFDDLPSIVENPTLGSWTRALVPPRGGFTVSGRPVLNLSFALNRALGGGDVTGYHQLNLAIHLLASLTLFGLVRRTLRSPALAARYGTGADWLAAVIALVWALHPLQTESVTYIAQRAESFAGLWYLLVLYCFARGAASPTPGRWFAASVAAAFLGVATKETVATAPLLVLLYDRTFVSGSWRTAWQRHRVLFAGLAASWLLLGALVAGNGSRGGTAGFAAPEAWWVYALTQVKAVALYLKLAAWPHPLVFDYGLARAVPPLQFAGGLAVVGSLVALTLWALRRSPAWGFLGAWFFVILAPSSSIIPVATQTMAEHRMYLPLAAIVTLVILAAHRWLGRGAVALGAALALAGAAGTAARNRDYLAPITLWTQALAHGENTRAHLNLGIQLAAANRPLEALAHYEAAAAADPRNAEAHYNRGNVLFDLRRTNEAATAYLTALQLKPELPKALFNLGNILARAHRLPEAATYYQAALQQAPDYGAAHYNLANTLVGLDRLREAIPHYQAAMRLMPAHVGAHFNLGNALMQADRPAEAAAEYEAVLRLEPGNPDAARNLAAAREAAARH